MIDRAESDQNGFFHFIEALEVLATNAENQCETYGNYNTPWEIQHDLADSVGLAVSPAIALSCEQQSAIENICRELLLLPKAAIEPKGMVMTTHAGCIAGMRHPDWEPLRRKAKELLALLAPAIAENRRYLNLQ
jgi:hypothetical protein